MYQNKLLMSLIYRWLIVIWSISLDLTQHAWVAEGQFDILFSCRMQEMPPAERCCSSRPLFPFMPVFFSLLSVSFLTFKKDLFVLFKEQGTEPHVLVALHI